MEAVNQDKAGEEYWSSFWQQYTMPPPVQLTPPDASNYAFREIHSFYEKVLPKGSLQLAEIGCGNSVYLSYYHRYFGYAVSGLDYSAYGCEQTRKILERDCVPGTIHQGDLFHPPAALTGTFDIVCSFGVVEHFDDTTDVIRHIAAFSKPGGLIVTTIPNLTGITGWLQKWMNRPVYNIHRVMGLKELEKHCRAAGLEVIASTRIIPISFGVTLDEHNQQRVRFKSLKKWVLKSFQVIEKIVCRIDDRFVRLPRTEFFCAGMIVVARKPA